MPKKRANGEWALYKRKDGRWAGNYTAQTAAGPKADMCMGKDQGRSRREAADGDGQQGRGFLLRRGQHNWPHCEIRKKAIR